MAVMPSSTLLAAIALVAALLVLFVLLPQTKRWRDEHTYFLELLLVLGGTFAGVFLALDMSARETRRQEAEEMKTLLAAASADVDRLGRELVSLYLTVPGSSATPSQVLLEVPPRLPTVLRSVLERDVVMRRGSPEGLGALQDAIEELGRLRSGLPASASQTPRLLQTVASFAYRLGYIADLLAIENALAQGLASPQAAANARNAALVRLHGVREVDIPAMLRGRQLRTLETVRWREVFRAH